jgi:hypothetical protein
MGDATRMITTIQKISRTSAQSSDLVYGTVTSVSPLKVKVGKLELTKEFLFLSPLCILTKMKINSTEYTLWRDLKVGDKVLMLKSSGGQMYYVLQRKEGIL